jgi:hypothetical protein
MLTLAGRGLLDVGKVPMGFESIMGSRWDCSGMAYLILTGKA